MKKSEPKAAKLTFWNELRIKNNLTMKDVADALHTSIGTVGGWFSGRTVPSEKYLTEVCQLFDVDVSVGYEEFAKATRDWDSDRGRMKFTLSAESAETDSVKKPTKSKKKSRKSKKVEVKPDIQPEVVPDIQPESTVDTAGDSKTVAVDVTPLLRHCYGTLPFDLYETLRATIRDGGYPLEVLYGNISCDEYNKIYRWFSNAIAEG